MELGGYVDAFEQSIRSALAIADALAPEDWDRPTDLPGWTVKDVVAHLGSIERELLGDAHPPALAEYGPHVRSDFGRHMEDGVAARRAWLPEAVVAELRDALPDRLVTMRAMRAEDPPMRVVADERWDTTLLLRNRAFDAWMHEQDVRRAVTRPGNLDGPGAYVVRETLLASLPYLVVKRAGATAGQTVRLTSTGAMPLRARVVVGDDGRGRIDDENPATATATVSADWVTWVRLLGGRMSPADAVVEIDGDRPLAQRLVDRLAVTP